MAFLKRAEFEKQIKDAIEKATQLYANVTVKKQILELPTSTIILNVEIPINGYIEDFPNYDPVIEEIKNWPDKDKADFLFALFKMMPYERQKHLLKELEELDELTLTPQQKAELTQLIDQQNVEPLQALTTVLTVEQMANHTIAELLNLLQAEVK